MKSKVVSVLALLLLAFFAFSEVSARGFGRGAGCAGYGNWQARMFQPSYQELDINADGQVTKQEHMLFREKRQANRPGRGYHAKWHANMFETMDSNGDAVVSPDEFTEHQWMRRTE